MGIQVSLLTQNKQPYEKEFIDFQFDGRYVSEFGLVAVVDGDRLLFDGSPSFQDEITTIKGVTGQYYWGTNIGAKTRTFTLATDGMTEQQVLEFQHHFQPGRYGKFIEDTLAYRYSYCRVSAPPQFKMIPFKRDAAASLKDPENKTAIYKSFINIYKGEITLTLTWDYPYSFSMNNYLEFNPDDENNYVESQLRAVFSNMLPSTLSWGYKDPKSGRLGIGVLKMMILGNGGIGNACYLGCDKRLTRSGFEEDTGFSTKQGDASINGKMLLYNPSVTASPAKIVIENFELQYTPINWDYVFSTSTKVASWQPVYFNNIMDSYNVGFAKVKRYIDGDSTKGTELVKPTKPYNTIQITPRLYPYSTINENGEYNSIDFEETINQMEANGEFSNRFHYTTPNVISSIHQCISIASRYGMTDGAKTARLELEEELRMNIHHDAVLNWAIRAITYIFGEKDELDNSTRNMSDANLYYFHSANIEQISASNNQSWVHKLAWFPYFNLLMLCFFSSLIEKNNTSNEITNKGTIALQTGSSSKVYYKPRPIILEFDGENNSATIKYYYNKCSAISATSYDSTVEKISDLREESCGDAILSGYLKIEGGNSLDAEGNIISCYCLGFKQGGYDYAVPLTKIRYKYIYL